MTSASADTGIWICMVAKGFALFDFRSEWLWLLAGGGVGVFEQMVE